MSIVGQYFYFAELLTLLSILFIFDVLPAAPAHLRFSSSL